MQMDMPRAGAPRCSQAARKHTPGHLHLELHGHSLRNSLASLLLYLLELRTLTPHPKVHRLTMVTSNWQTPEAMCLWPSPALCQPLTLPKRESQEPEILSHKEVRKLGLLFQREPCILQGSSPMTTLLPLGLTTHICGGGCWLKGHEGWQRVTVGLACGLLLLDYTFVSHHISAWLSWELSIITLILLPQFLAPSVCQQRNWLALWPQD